MYEFVADNGVFSHRKIDDGSRLLIETLIQKDLGSSLLDLGCGYGPIAIVLALKHPSLEVTLCDINERAVALANQNITKHELLTRASAQVSDGLSEITSMFDTVVTNPPIRAGKDVVFRFYKEAKVHLKPGGNLYIVIRKAQGAASSEAYLRTIYRDVTRIGRSKGYHVYQAHD